MIAIGLVGTLVVVTAALFTKLMASSTKSTNQTVGLLFAQRRMEAALGTGPPFWGAASPMTYDAVRRTWTESATDTTGFGGGPGGGVYTTDENNKTLFYHKLEATLVRAQMMGDMYRLKVDVIWWPNLTGSEPQAVVRQGVGKQSITLTRLFYYQKVKDKGWSPAGYIP